MKKGWILRVFVVLALIIAIIAQTSFAEILIGMVNNIPYGQEIKVSIINNNPNCEGTCTKTLDTSGYFQTDLDYEINDTLTLYAYYEEVLNSNTEAAQSIPYNIRLTICDPPNKPILYELGTVHTTSVQLDWLAEDAAYSAVSIDGDNFYEAESPITLNNLKSGNHTWTVKACGYGCCAKEVQSTFRIDNDVPDKPQVEMTAKGLEIKKGNDSDSDETFVEYRINGQEPIKGTFFDINNLNVEARTCDSFGCSDWVSKKITSCGDTGRFFGEPVINTSSQEPANYYLNYSDFFSEFKNIMQTENKVDMTTDVSCAKQMNYGIDALKEIMSSKINEANSFVINTNVPSTIKSGDDIEINIDFISQEMHENVTFEIISELEFTKKNYDFIVDSEKVNAVLTAKTKDINASTYPVIVKVSDFSGILYTKQFNIEIIYTMSDFQYKLNEIKLKSKGFIDLVTQYIVIFSVLIVCIVLILHFRLKKKFSKELIAEARLKKDRDLALTMLSQKQNVDNLKQETNKEEPKINIDELKKEVSEKTNYEKKLDNLEEKRDSYMQRNDERRNTYL